MPRYFFHVDDGHILPDVEGVDLSGLEEATSLAIQTVGQILCDKGRRSWEGAEMRMEVFDASGQVVIRLRFSVEDANPEPEA